MAKAQSFLQAIRILFDYNGSSMIIRVILLSALFLIGWRIFLRRTKLPGHILVVFGILGLAAGAVLFPDASNDIAHVLGVGRGADLITYLVEVGILFVVLHYYMKFVELEERITELVREIALLRPRCQGARSQACLE